MLARKKPQTHYVRTSSRYVGPSDGWVCCRCQLIWAWDGVGGWGEGGSLLLTNALHPVLAGGPYTTPRVSQGRNRVRLRAGLEKRFKKTTINKLSCNTISNLKLVEPYKWESCKKMFTRWFEASFRRIPSLGKLHLGPIKKLHLFTHSSKHLKCLSV